MSRKQTKITWDDWSTVYHWLVYPAGYLDIFCFLQTPIIGPNHGVHLLVSHNSLRCDCRDYDIIAKLRIFTRSDWLHGIHCTRPKHLSGRKVSFYRATANAYASKSVCLPLCPSHACIMIQAAQLSQRYHAARWVSYGQKWKTGTERQYLQTI